MVAQVEMLFSAAVDAQHDRIGAEVDAGDLHGVTLAGGGAVETQSVAQLFHVERFSGRNFVALFSAGQRLHHASEFAVDETDEQQPRLRLERGFAGVIRRLLDRGLLRRRGRVRRIRRWKRGGSGGASAGGQRPERGDARNVRAQCERHPESDRDLNAHNGWPILRRIGYGVNSNFSTLRGLTAEGADALPWLRSRRKAIPQSPPYPAVRRGASNYCQGSL